MDLVGFMLSYWINARICGLYLVMVGLCLYLMVADLCLCFVLQHLRKFHLFSLKVFFSV